MRVHWKTTLVAAGAFAGDHRDAEAGARGREEEADVVGDQPARTGTLGASEERITSFLEHRRRPSARRLRRSHRHRLCRRADLRP